MSVCKSLTVHISAAAIALSTGLFVGCDNKEKVLDVETPSGEIEVERDTDTGDVEVDVNKEE